MNILDIGCGNNKYKSSGDIVIGMDIVRLLDVDIVHDMEVFPYPFHDHFFDKVVMHHSLEHVSKNNNIRIIEEVYRLLKPHGKLIVEVPIGQWYHYDPTHKNYVCIWYWKYFSSTYPLNYYTNARFKLISSELMGIHGIKYIEYFNSLMNRLYQISPEGMERFINFINLDAATKYTLRRL